MECIVEDIASFWHTINLLLKEEFSLWYEEKMTKKLLKLSNVEIKSQKFHYSKIDFNKILIAITMDYRKISTLMVAAFLTNCSNPRQISVTFKIWIIFNNESSGSKFFSHFVRNILVPCLFTRSIRELDI